MLFKKQKQIILIGDLVTHVLYNRDWIGLVISIKDEENKLGKREAENALVHMIPGTEYQFFFRRRYGKESFRKGWISTRWLLKI